MRALPPNLPCFPWRDAIVVAVVRAIHLFLGSAALGPGACFVGMDLDLVVGMDLGLVPRITSAMQILVSPATGKTWGTTSTS